MVNRVEWGGNNENICSETDKLATTLSMRGGD